MLARMAEADNLSPMTTSLTSPLREKAGKL
jgi:hypothetical protein